MDNSIIYNYEIVNKIDFYGYHKDPEIFLKIYFYDDSNFTTIKHII